ncbi:peroxidase [Ixodes scapularis]|nr:peroxidase [Ixodes scapularis]
MRIPDTLLLGVLAFLVGVSADITVSKDLESVGNLAGETGPAKSENPVLKDVASAGPDIIQGIQRSTKETTLQTAVSAENTNRSNESELEKHGELSAEDESDSNEADEVPQADMAPLAPHHGRSAAPHGHPHHGAPPAYVTILRPPPVHPPPPPAPRPLPVYPPRVPKGAPRAGGPRRPGSDHGGDKRPPMHYRQGPPALGKGHKLDKEERRRLPLRCNKNLRYRTYDGSCNNLHAPCWGRAGESFGRLLKPAYADGLHQPRRGEYGRPLPNPRLVSLALAGGSWQTSDTEYTFHTDLLTHFGQLLAHDLTSSATFTTTQTVNGKTTKAPPKCCGKERPNAECSHIVIHHTDEFYPAGHCMENVRSDCYNASRTSCAKNSPGPYREQINEVTSFIDASIVYGSSEEESKKLRSEDGKGAKMLMDKTSLYIPKGLLPRKSEGECFSYMPGCDKQCFRAGDNRASLTPVIASLQTLLVREHNHIADKLKKKGWPNDKIYHVARKMISACLQVIAYKEYLPHVLGPEVVSRYRLQVPTVHYYYNETLNPSLLNTYAAAANRLPHAVVGTKFEREGHKCFHTSRVSYDLNTMDDFCKPRTDPVRSLVVGAACKHLQHQDTVYSKEITRFLFSNPPNLLGKDLLSLDVDRGRDHGLPPYVHYRKLCGLRPVYSFDDFKKESKSYDAVNRLQAVYGNHFEDLDLVAGLALEKPVLGSFYGPTAVCIMGEQYYRLKYADRFWFEHLYHPGAFSKDQVRDILKVSMATLICRNTDVEFLQRNVFKMSGKGNSKVNCKAILAETDYNYDLYK